MLRRPSKKDGLLFFIKKTRGHGLWRFEKVIPSYLRLMLKNLLLLFIGVIAFTGCSQKSFSEKWTKEQAPDYFQARFETTRGVFDIEARREWSPEGVDRLYQLITSNFYTDIAIFRVVPDFVVQFGINTDSTLNSQWKAYPVNDEPVVKTNEKGTISFARGGAKSRSTQIFVNLKSNSPYLDETDYGGVKGFPVVAQVIAGMDVVEGFFGEYGNQPATQQDQIYAKGNVFLKEKYPKLDYILKAYVLKN